MWWRRSWWLLLHTISRRDGGRGIQRKLWLFSSGRCQGGNRVGGRRQTSFLCGRRYRLDRSPLQNRLCRGRFGDRFVLVSDIRFQFLDLGLQVVEPMLQTGKLCTVCTGRSITGRHRVNRDARHRNGHAKALPLVFVASDFLTSRPRQNLP